MTMESKIGINSNKPPFDSLEKIHRTLQFALNNAQEAIVQIGIDNRIIFVNDSACRQLGYASDQLIGMPIDRFDKQLTESECLIRWEELRKHGSFQNESTYRLSNGGEIPVEILSRYFKHNEEEYIFVYFKNISEHKSSAARMDYFAHYDRTTRLPNRILLTNRLNQAIHLASSRNTMVTVLVIGLDRFKLVNDILGNTGGDEILKIAADRMVKCVREMDTVARVGGDEFSIVLEQVSTRVEEMSQTAQRILDIFLQPFSVSGQELFVMCSIGVAVYPKNGRDADELLKNASAALQQAKAQGGNSFCLYTSAPGSRNPERWQLEFDLRNALAHKELHLHYQPRVDAISGAILGAEALLRWQHPKRGMILPEQFITLAEETGLIFKIGEWVLDTACKQRKLWAEQGLKLGRIGVNLSARQFRQKELVGTIARILEETGLDPRLLELELTESLLMHDVSLAIQTMNELKNLGVHIALDDFGTGYSSLSYLRYFPIDTLKIDRSFVSEITFDENSVAIAEAIIVMAHRLKLTVIAEGVETQEQLAILRERGCDQIQGYHFSHALTAKELTRVLSKNINL